MIEMYGWQIVMLETFKNGIDLWWQCVVVIYLLLFGLSLHQCTCDYFVFRLLLLLWCTLHQGVVAEN